MSHSGLPARGVAACAQVSSSSNQCTRYTCSKPTQNLLQGKALDNRLVRCALRIHHNVCGAASGGFHSARTSVSDGP